MAVSHVYSNTNADATGTLTIWNGATTSTVAATNLVRPGDWNSAHNQFITLTGNTAGTSTVSGTNIIFGATNGIQISGSSNSIFFARPLQNGWNPDQNAVQVVAQNGQNSLFFRPVDLYFPIAIDRVVMPIHVSGATNSTASCTLSIWLCLYTRNVSSLSSVYSSLLTTQFTYSGTASSSNLAGIRNVSFPWTTTFVPDNYVIGILSQTATGGNNASISNVQVSAINSTHSGHLGVGSNASAVWMLGSGRYSTTTGGMPAAVSLTQIQGLSSAYNRHQMVHFTSGTV